MLTAYQESYFHEIATSMGIDVSQVKPIFKENMHRLLIKAGFLSCDIWT